MILKFCGRLTIERAAKYLKESFKNLEVKEVKRVWSILRKRSQGQAVEYVRRLSVDKELDLSNREKLDHGLEGTGKRKREDNSKM
jgi:hypothetical protein